MMEEKKEIVPVEIEGKIISPIVSAENARKGQFQEYSNTLARAAMAVTGLKKFNLVAVKSDFYDKGKPVE